MVLILISAKTKQHATGKKFQEILEEAIINPLHVEGELYIGIPPGKTLLHPLIFSFLSIISIKFMITTIVLGRKYNSWIALRGKLLLSFLNFLSLSPGVETRLATLTPNLDDLQKFSGINRSDLPSTFQPAMIAQFATTLTPLFNMLNTRRAIIPAANGHCSARALARYYAALADGGVIPPPHSSSSQPALGSHPHIPKFTSEIPKKQKAARSKDGHTNVKNDHEKNSSSTETAENNSIFRTTSNTGYTRLLNDNSTYSNTNDPSTRVDTRHADAGNKIVGKMYKDPRILDAFLGKGEFEKFTIPNGKFGLGFSRLRSEEGSFIGFGHSGMGGSTGFCNIDHRFAMSVTLNKMSLGGVTASIIQLVCSELNIPLPAEFSSPGISNGQSSRVETPLIN